MPAEAPSIRIYPQSWLVPGDINSHFEHPGQPLEIDIGCGKGRFVLARAEDHPDINYLGIERMLRRVRKVSNKSLHRRIRNLRLLRADAFYTVTYLLPEASVDTYYLFFPDPWPKARHHKNRLMGPLFTEALVRTLKPGGMFHFATDHLPYFEAVSDQLREDARFTPVEPFVPEEHEQTDFERWYLGKKPIGRASYLVQTTA